ncbi:hypothetical protein H310_14217 [Aphanomyces invadans]|uniref:PHD-type domain-containing protein n=1 Tax=Aphanomyces invadans TaxID=157072 RepID=A0A024TCP4_9STRA|nr:hypothetical protein H310_14217 [Aphanomyces invadans]ETV91122.1 hypothetical protein H310_14217 [Aphanomyces invadans]|eukprot:XP_008880249.1 hypothetical protein H310_14217 [Aphanomyces invadans]
MAVQGPVGATNGDESSLAMLPDRVSVDFNAPKTVEIGERPADKQQTGGDVDVVNGTFRDAVTIYDDEKQAILSFLTYIHDKPHDVAAWSLETSSRRRRQAASSARKNCRPPTFHPHPNSMSPVSPTTSSSAPSLLDGLYGHKRKLGVENLHDSDSSSNDGHTSLSHTKRLKMERSPSTCCICHNDSPHVSPTTTIDFHDMIACNNKLCRDPTNWYHSSCVGLLAPPDTTWHCPNCTRDTKGDILPENLFRKPALSITYGDMIAAALRATACGEGTFKEICEFIERRYESQLNWKLESDQRKSPVWKSSVRKILFSNNRFARHPSLKGVFCLVVQPPATPSPLPA